MTFIRGTQYIKKNMVKNKFALAFNKVKEFSLNVQETAIPGINLGYTTLDNPFINRPIFNTKPEYEELEIKFVVDDVMNSWGMINDWMRSFAPVDMTFNEGFESNTEFDSNRRELPDVYDYKNMPDVGLETPSALYDSATLIINDSGGIAELEVRFFDIFPTALSPLPLDIGADSDDLVLATAKFKYWYYTIHRRGEI